MSLTLSNLVDNINEVLVQKEGAMVSGPLEVCRYVKDTIQSEKFYETLKQYGLENILVFEEGLELMDKVYLKISPNDTCLRPIIKINMNISYFDEQALKRGGYLSYLKCYLIGEGKSMAGIPVEQVVMGLQFSELKNREAELDAEIKKLQERLEECTTEHTSIKNKMLELVEKLKEVAGDES